MKYDIRDSIAKRGGAGRGTICATHRQAYLLADRIEKSDPFAARRLRTLMARAFDQGKRMNDTMKRHKAARS